MEEQQTRQGEDSKPLLKRLREAVFPVKPDDKPIVKVSKNIGFAMFLILFSCVSLVLAAAISFAL
ncbi:hypothetical protein SAMN05660909_05294 [Chitinophaga terrae (ex Kim and Jung 2007)]|jgi:hypothetical protein|uniref:Uncharacterized protein n=1 Tax=Chitinophaga terrae (ex Kim and Jung 2007) TaxID=408074 RepID=A0A1H4GFK2_9BACT|nr:hypothetical protein [Chitinophaga terrae (ex Kim and Jung 2007)]MDQ0110053.1 hypothetical protein [Chitinophaga terrae (ex Kim and Jung 2007)]GEP93409.1 hypothetical protein CTE07_50540 [Chitinophaga terrae (ex Kim and Jung 2007)]SEB08403.1 hypothetical protein SAMN05660909_05294 [Chitinophaga terrae (ex Kim and Jung 2007)]